MDGESEEKSCSASTLHVLVLTADCLHGWSRHNLNVTSIRPQREQSTALKRPTRVDVTSHTVAGAASLDLHNVGVNSISVSPPLM